MSFQTINLLKIASESWPDNIAVFHNEEKTSFRKLYREVLLLNELLEFKIKLKGHGIGLVAGNNVNFINGLFACSGAGLVVMPIWKSLTAPEILSSIEQASINMILIEGSNKTNFDTEHQRIQLNTYFDLLVFHTIRSESITDKFEDAAFIRPSSGTTGNSKGVVISHQSVEERIIAANEGLQLNETDKVLWVLPMAFHFVVSIILYIKYGSAIIISDELYADSILEEANRHKATLLYASPIHYRLLVVSAGNSKFTSLKKAICTSAGIERSIITDFEQKYGIPLTQAFGIIEIGLPIINTNNSKDHINSTGKALASYRVTILDDELNSTPPNTIGMLAIKGPGMFSGYLWPIQTIESVLQRSWFITGDIAQISEDGYITISGRKKSIINISGNKVFPEEVENILKLHPLIMDARVYRGSHPVTGETVEAELILKRNSNLTQTEITAFCRDHLASIKIPQKVVFVKEIPKTKTGKTIRS
jgi:acyl-coenzyme A synthetase/AMP-(fatty) acid ligase